MRVFGAGWSTRGLARRLVLEAAHLLVALAVVFGPLQSGARYFYCEALGELSVSDPCGPHARGSDSCPFESVQRQSVDCCSVIKLPLLPSGAQSPEHTVPAACVSAVLAALDYAGTPQSQGADDFARRSKRWARPPRPGGELRARLMVFLT
jgi:hypothetical protein